MVEPLRRLAGGLCALALVGCGAGALWVEAWMTAASGTVIPEFGGELAPDRAKPAQALALPVVPVSMPGLRLSGPLAAVAAASCERRWIYQLVATPPEAGRELEECVSLRRHEVSVSPRSAGGWLDLARLLAAQDGLTARALAALRMSYLAAPHEGALAERRVLFALDVWGDLPPADRVPLVRDFALIVGTRDRIVNVIDRVVADPRAAAVVAEIADAVGPGTPEWFAAQLRRRRGGEP